MVLINPNTSTATTRLMTAIARRSLSAAGLPVRGVTAPAGPSMLTTPAALRAAVPHVLTAAHEALTGGACTALVVGAFGDPGVSELRARWSRGRGEGTVPPYDPPGAGTGPRRPAGDRAAPGPYGSPDAEPVPWRAAEDRAASGPEGSLPPYGPAAGLATGPAGSVPPHRPGWASGPEGSVPPYGPAAGLATGPAGSVPPCHPGLTAGAEGPAPPYGPYGPEGLAPGPRPAGVGHPAWGHGTLGVPVVGIGEAALAEAAAGGRRFGIATTTPRLAGSIVAHVARLGLADRFTGTRFTPGSPGDLASRPDVLLAALEEAVRACVVRDGAEAVVIGGGPLGDAATALQDRLDLPVIAPVPAACRQLLRLLGEQGPQG
ncbi:aspartate/glutamate racemase family protein [Streptomyces sp. NPDC006339]|uniref:aspartate/glutamate racemase family protein n=1 Tax=Streptomyces sp. NPDC006339 TaxID=3156755 RepID=UPI0033B0A3C2